VTAGTYIAEVEDLLASFQPTLLYIELIIYYECCVNGYIALTGGGCEKCGDNIINGPEECDGTASCGINCFCSNGYLSNGSGCHYCGDLILNGPEECDGTLNCANDCTCGTGYKSNGAGCESCGDLTPNGFEGCDDANC